MWPDSLFKAMYAAYVKRRIADELDNRRALEMAALWGNPNYDPQKEGSDGARRELYEKVNEQYSNVVNRLYSDDAEDYQDDDDYDPDDPFWAAMERGMAKHKLPKEESAATISED